MKIFIVRGAFLNPFELQNYSPLKEKFDITAISSKHPISDKIDLPLIKLWSPTDIPNIPFKYPILNRLFTDAHQLLGLRNKIKGADLVHVAETYYGYTNQAVMAKRRGLIRKIVSTVWETIPGNNEGIKGRKEYKRMARENIDHFIAVTERAKRALMKEGVKEDKITVINAGIDIKRFKPMSGQKTKRDLNILCVARLVPEKGVEDLLKAFLEIYVNNKNIHLTFIGNGSLKHDLKGFKNVHIKQSPYGKIHREYHHADIFCLPSRSEKEWEEQFGTVLTEAMASGLPIVTTTSGGIPEVCGDVAVYAKPANYQDLKTSLEKLIYNKNLRLAMGKRSREMAVAKYDREKISKKIEGLYNKLCLSKKV